MMQKIMSIIRAHRQKAEEGMVRTISSMVLPQRIVPYAYHTILNICGGAWKVVDFDRMDVISIATR
jgi:hypothetical protein